MTLMNMIEYTSMPKQLAQSGMKKPQKHHKYKFKQR